MKQKAKTRKQEWTKEQLDGTIEMVEPYGSVHVSALIYMKEENERLRKALSVAADELHNHCHWDCNNNCRSAHEALKR